MDYSGVSGDFLSLHRAHIDDCSLTYGWIVADLSFDRSVVGIVGSDVVDLHMGILGNRYFFDLFDL